MRHSYYYELLLVYIREVIQGCLEEIFVCVLTDVLFACIYGTVSRSLHMEEFQLQFNR